MYVLTLGMANETDLVYSIQCRNVLCSAVSPSLSSTGRRKRGSQLAFFFFFSIRHIVYLMI